jgi:hypothetical protein
LTEIPATVDLALEVTPPASGVERAKRFYQSLGRRRVDSSFNPMRSFTGDVDQFLAGRGGAH